MMHLGRALGWQRSEIRGMRLDEFTDYLALAPEVIKQGG